ncbi:DUF1822 family protein [Aetokthonos hydrillicola Thurmond2011]|jgi:hypothetical protein|uniref:DUF1822 family protein n=1 Tax=Aetokthonos hydrillicola Thurmond2011 TaxID=2712845 RepID=A0AAP5I3C5_9CYAN|nr:DUF1822 family protein [Aetokthonos hydrillicola]MBO3458256.1 DUF1822 family protein [Aetokthonos hydrillicola CCALA 1050]MBW4586717.1 DUF1822 family protein [Aetokthonos hydrillicola CCALA 1050]MDR9893956.1 DUF1822 family protein [Aetokthonos hydrillicola Thurmond2011]
MKKFIGKIVAGFALVAVVFFGFANTEAIAAIAIYDTRPDVAPITEDQTLTTRTQILLANNEEGTKRAKLIDTGVQLGDLTVALLVNILEEDEGRLHVLAQLHPTDGETYLPPNIRITLLTKAKKILQEVTSRTQDNYIQLKPFKGEVGKAFSIKVSLGDIDVVEEYEL